MKNKIYLFLIICSAFSQFNCDSKSQKSVTIKTIEVNNFLFPIDKTGEDTHLKIMDDSVYVLTQKIESLIIVSVYVYSLSGNRLRKLESFYNKKKRTRASIDYYDALKRPNGFWSSWHPNGQVHQVIKYNHGEEVSYTYQFNEKGIMTHFCNWDSTGYFPKTVYRWSDENHLITIAPTIDRELSGFRYDYYETIDSSYFSHENIDSTYSKEGRISEAELKKLFNMETSQLPQFYYSMDGLDATK
jgi:hypothetical protein